jgi:hypothetical protein
VILPSSNGSNTTSAAECVLLGQDVS